MSRFLIALALSSAFTTAAVAQTAPQPVPIIDQVPEPEDRPLSAPMKLEVDATDVARAIFRVKQTIPVEAGKPLILLYPQWLPGKHGPRGALAEMTGLKIRSGGKLLNWTRDPVEVYAFHVDTPSGTRSVDVEFQFTSPVQSSEGRVVVTPAMMNIQWEQVALYPAGHFTRAIQVQPSIMLPKGWTGVAALDVYAHEPLAADHPLRALPNALLSPHLGFVTQPVFERFYSDMAEGVLAWLRGEPIPRRMPAPPNA